jgi:hypothetical protein
MKVTPVQGTPTINQPQTTGLSPEKLIKLKSIASGQAPESVETPTTEEENPQGSPDGQTEIGVSDTNEQANVVAEDTKPLSPQFAQLAKQRRNLQVKEAELAKREAALTGPSRVDLEAELKSSPLKVLERVIGENFYDKLTQDILALQNGQQPIDTNALKAELRKELSEELQTNLTTRETQAEEQALTAIAADIDSVVSEGDDFELIRETQSQEEVLRHIHDTWKKTGRLLDEREACRFIEDQILQKQLKLSKLKKLQGKLTPEEPVQAAPPQTGGIRTLTNNHQAKPVTDRRQRAIAAMQGKLTR